MADTIAIMNQGVIEQLGAPLEVYERPASVFVADFIGAPAMNFLPFEAGAGERRRRGRDRRRADRRAGRCARTCRRARCCAACGPSTCASTTPRRCAPRCSAPNTSARARIVTLATAAGRARCAPRSTSRSAVRARRPRRPGLRRRGVSLFDAASGRALRTARDDAPHAAPAGSAPWLSFASPASSKRFGAVQAVDGLEPRHRRAASSSSCSGPSGAGKTTTLRLVAGLERPDAGQRPHRRARRHARSRRRCATWPSCSSSTRSIRT